MGRPVRQKRPAPDSKVEVSIEKRRGTHIDVADTTSRPKKRAKRDAILNQRPLTPLSIFVCGAGDSGELGLGAEKRNGRKPYGAMVPRLNELLGRRAPSSGVVQIAVGGMHCAALTKDSQILTWGVNDDGALGRDTAWNAPMRDINADSDESEDEDEIDLNPKESTPAAVPQKSFGDKDLVQVVATDCATFVLTSDGLVFGWGTFKASDGTLGFSTDDALRGDKVQKTPILIHNLRNIKDLAAGGNHVLALDHDGNIFSWGCDEQNQLGYRRLPKYPREAALTPFRIGPSRKRIKSIFCGAYHSFAFDGKDHVYAWGLNNFGQTGIPSGAGEEGDRAMIKQPTLVKSLEQHSPLREIRGGTHHSIACTQDGKVLVWGRCDDCQIGIPLKELSQADLLFDSRGRPRILTLPSVVPGISGISVSAGIDDCLSISREGKAYAWGFSAGYRTGVKTEDSVEMPRLMESKDLAGRTLSFAGCGGQFSVIAGPAPLTNGV